MSDLRELLRPRVERGAALLDSVEPRWWERVTDALDVSRCDLCPLGQIYGDVDDGYKELCPPEHQRWPWQWAADHGFERTLRGPEDDADSEYRTLDDLWLEAIAERRQS